MFRCWKGRVGCGGLLVWNCVMTDFNIYKPVEGKNFKLFSRKLEFAGVKDSGNIGRKLGRKQI